MWIKPYLFRLEAVEIAELMTVVSGKLHWIINTEMADMLSALVRFNGRELITDIWNISSVGDGFEADTVIEGHLYKVQHLLPFEPWGVVPAQNPVNEFGKSSEQVSPDSFNLKVEPSATRTLSSALRTHKPPEDEVGQYDAAAVLDGTEAQTDSEKV
jgi:hypothetical protein